MPIRIFANNQTSLVNPPIFDASQVDASQLSPGFNAIINPNQAFDAVQLPLALAGTVVWGMLVGGPQEFLGVYAKNGTSDKINGASNDVMFVFPNIPQTVSQNFICVCEENGAWCCNFSVAFP